MALDGDPGKSLEEMIVNSPIESDVSFENFLRETGCFDQALAQISTSEELVQFVREVSATLGDYISRVKPVPFNGPFPPEFMNGVRLRSINPGTFSVYGIQEGQYVRLFFDGRQYFSIFSGRLLEWPRHSKEFHIYWKFDGVV